MIIVSILLIRGPWTKSAILNGWENIFLKKCLRTTGEKVAAVLSLGERKQKLMTAFLLFTFDVELTSVYSYCHFYKYACILEAPTIMCC